MDLLIALILGLVGLIAGAASGLFGVGGGILVVPGLIVVAQLSFGEAVAASLVFIVLTSPLGVWRHWVHRNVDFRKGTVLGIAGILGVVGGEGLQRMVTERQLILAFAVLLVWAAQHLVYGRLPTRSNPSKTLLVLVGVFSGLAAKLFGIGGGIVVVPALVFIGLPVHRAVGTSLVSVFINAAFATILNLGKDQDWALWALPPAAGALLGVQLGVRTGARMHVDALRQAFAIVLALVALDLARRAF